MQGREAIQSPDHLQDPPVDPYRGVELGPAVNHSVPDSRDRPGPVDHLENLFQRLAMIRDLHGSHLFTCGTIISVPQYAPLPADTLYGSRYQRCLATKVQNAELH